MISHPRISKRIHRNPPYILGFVDVFSSVKTSSICTIKFNIKVPSSQFCLEQNPQFLGLHPLWAAALPRPLRPLGQLWPLGHSAFGLYMLGFHIWIAQVLDGWFISRKILKITGMIWGSPYIYIYLLDMRKQEMGQSLSSPLPAPSWIIFLKHFWVSCGKKRRQSLNSRGENGDSPSKSRTLLGINLVGGFNHLEKY